MTAQVTLKDLQHIGLNHLANTIIVPFEHITKHGRSRYHTEKPEPILTPERLAAVNETLSYMFYVPHGGIISSITKQNQIEFVLGPLLTTDENGVYYKGYELPVGERERKIFEMFLDPNTHLGDLYMELSDYEGGVTHSSYSNGHSLMYRLIDSIGHDILKQDPANWNTMGEYLNDDSMDAIIEDLAMVREGFHLSKNGWACPTENVRIEMTEDPKVISGCRIVFNGELVKLPPVIESTIAHFVAPGLMGRPVLPRDYEGLLMSLHNVMTELSVSNTLADTLVAHTRSLIEHNMFMYTMSNVLDIDGYTEHVYETGRSAIKLIDMITDERLRRRNRMC